MPPYLFQAGVAALSDGLQPQDRPNIAHHTLDDTRLGAVPLRRSRGSVLVRLRHGCYQRHGVLDSGPDNLSAYIHALGGEDVNGKCA